MKGEIESYSRAHLAKNAKERQHGHEVSAPDLKPGDPEFKSRSDHQLDFSFNSLDALVIANWSTSCQLGFLMCPVHLSNLFHRPNWLIHCCTQFKPFGNKTFCFRNFHII